MKYRIPPYCLLSILFIGVLLSSCVDVGSNKRVFRIGVAQCSDDTWRKKMNDELLREAAIDRNVQIEIRSADDNDSIQIADIDYFRKQGVDLIILSPNTSNAVVPAVERAYNDGIPIILVDRTIDTDSVTAYIGADNHAIGQMVGGYVATRLNHKGRLLEITGLPGSSPARERHEGFVEALKNEKDIEISTIIHADWTEKTAREKTDSLLRSNGGVFDYDLVFAHNDRMCEGAQQSIDSLVGKDTGALFVGIDALTGDGMGVSMVKEGRMDASFLYPTRGDIIMETAMKILNGEPYERNQVLPTALVDASNAYVLLLQAREMESQTAKLEHINSQVDEMLGKYSLQEMFLVACIIIIVLFIVLFTYILHSYHEKANLAMQLQEQKQQIEAEREKVVAATSAKLSFFTGVSHDFRTPLTLIADPIRRVKDSPSLSANEKLIMDIAFKNVNILLRLINQVLDIRKYESGKLSLKLVNTDIHACLESWVGAFQPLAHQKQIRLSLEADDTSDWIMAFDPEKMERIIFNLLSNALKYTQVNGKVVVRCFVDGDFVCIDTSDNGMGIQEAELKKIFDSYYQIDESRQHNSSGIGLALSKSFVELHGGTITVDSVYGKGTTFHCRFPRRKTGDDADELQKLNAISSEMIINELKDIKKEDSSQPQIDENRPSILIIDDNQDMQTYIASLLEDKYSIIRADNGKQGVAYANKYTPDLVICDMMMPVMDGLECCRVLKSDVLTSHIPVLILTACAFDEERIDSYNNGADGFLGKPFDSRILLSRIDSLIKNHKRVTDFLAESAIVSPSADTDEKKKKKSDAVDLDADFINKFKKIVNRRISDTNMSVESIGDELGLGRVQLYRKVKALTNYSPVELIRIIRLKKAQSLISSGNGQTMSEISYAVGFSSPSYFAKCYKDFFGESPTETHDRKKY